MYQAHPSFTRDRLSILNAALSLNCRSMSQMLYHIECVRSSLELFLPLNDTRTPGQAQLSPIAAVALCKPFTGLVQLHDIDILLEEHDGSTGKREDPWHG